MKKILVTGSNGYIGNALVLALLNRKKEFTVRAAARRGSILNSKSFETVRLGSLEESLDYVEAFKGCDVPDPLRFPRFDARSRGLARRSCAAQN